MARKAAAVFLYHKYIRVKTVDTFVFYDIMIQPRAIKQIKNFCFAFARPTA